jgi:tetratricopeptide (TPR) repeat protein
MTPGRRPSSSRTYALVLLVASVWLSLSGAAAAAAGRADEAEAQARKRFTRGKQLYDEHRYREAAQEFEAGYAIVPKPGFLLNIGHSYRRAGEVEKARHYYELFLEKDKSSPQRGEVQGYIKAIDEALADQRESEARTAAPPAAPETSRSTRPVEILRTPSEPKAVAPPPAPPPPASGPSPASLEPGLSPGAAGTEACAERAAAQPAPRWPWVLGAVLAVAGGVAAAVALTRSSTSTQCGSLGCLNER